MHEIKTDIITTGQVSNCTLAYPLQHQFQMKSVDGTTSQRKICTAHFGTKSRTEAFDTCKALNARLPLPLNAKENKNLLKIVKSDYNITTGSVHLDMSDTLKSGTV